jgi:hypothetical protein
MLDDLKTKVENILKTNKTCRDNYLLLIFKVWAEEAQLSDDMRETLRHLYRLHKENRISSTESITRARRKIQEENPDLQGTMREQRKEQAELFRKEMRK